MASLFMIPKSDASSFGVLALRHGSTCVSHPVESPERQALRGPPERQVRRVRQELLVLPVQQVLQVRREQQVLLALLVQLVQ